MQSISMHHTLDICHEVAEKLRHYEKVAEYVQEAVMRGQFSTDHWLELSLIEGLPGLTLFYGVMDQLFPNEGWDQTAYAYIKLTTEKMESKGIENCSLFGGLAGICLAILICSKKGFRYPLLLSRAEELLFSHTESALLTQIDRLLDTFQPIPPHLYDLSNGITGILAYLLMRKENSACCRLAKDCLNRLIRLLTQEHDSDGHKIPGWYVSSNDQLEHEEKIKYLNGGFLLGMPDGITGCLSILSLALLEGIVVPNQYECIHKIASWLESKQGITTKGHPFWHHTLSLEEEMTNRVDLPASTKDAWIYGTPVVSRSLYLAAKATQDAKLMKFAEESFVSIFTKTWQEWNLMGTSFFWGRAGLLALTYAMAQDTRNPILLNQTILLEQDLNRFYHPSHPFGFQTVDVPCRDEYRWVDHPGLINGATGIVLSLLLNHTNQETNWCRMYLIK